MNDEEQTNNRVSDESDDAPKQRYEAPRIEESAKFETLAFQCTFAQGSCPYGASSA